MTVADRIGIGAVRCYQRFLSRYTVPCPDPISCSQYAIDAIREYGLSIGLDMTVQKIKQCGDVDWSSGYPSRKARSNGMGQGHQG